MSKKRILFIAIIGVVFFLQPSASLGQEILDLQEARIELIKINNRSIEKGEFETTEKFQERKSKFVEKKNKDVSEIIGKPLQAEFKIYDEEQRDNSPREELRIILNKYDADRQRYNIEFPEYINPQKLYFKIPPREAKMLSKNVKEVKALGSFWLERDEEAYLIKDLEIIFRDKKYHSNKANTKLAILGWQHFDLGKVKEIKISPNAKMIAGGGESGLTVCEYPSGSDCDKLTKESETVKSLDWSPSGNQIAGIVTWKEGRFTPKNKAEVRVWETSNFEIKNKVKLNSGWDDHSLVYPFNDDNVLVGVGHYSFGNRNGGLFNLDLEKEEFTRLIPQKNPVSNLRISRADGDDYYLTSVEKPERGTKIIKVWKGGSEALNPIQQIRSEYGTNGISYLPEKGYLLYTNKNNLILQGVESEKIIWQNYGIPIGNLAFSPSGDWIGSGDNAEFSILETSTGNVIRAKNGAAYGLTFSPDQTKIIYCNVDDVWAASIKKMW